MGIVTAIAAVAVAAGSAYSASKQEDAEDAAYASAQEQKKAGQESKARNAAQAASERRQQIREARVRAARIQQAGENTGTAGSSAEFGALGAINTQLQSNTAFNVGQVSSANRTSDFLQNAADFNTQMQQELASAAVGKTVSDIGSSIFSASGGFSNFKSTPQFDGAFQGIQHGTTSIGDM